MLLINPGEVSRALNLSPWQLIENRFNLTVHRTPGGHRRYDIEEIIKLKTQLETLRQGEGVLPIV